MKNLQFGLKEIGKVNQFHEASFLEIFYNENDKVIEFNYRKEMLPNDISLSELDEKPIASDRKTFELFKNILSKVKLKDIAF